MPTVPHSAESSPAAVPGNVPSAQSRQVQTQTKTAPATSAEGPAASLFPATAPPPDLRLRQLTSGGCCTGPFWSADNRHVQYIDRPASRPLGIYGVSVDNIEPPVLISEWIVSTSENGEYYVYPDGNTTIVQRAATGEEYVIPNGGRQVSVSPDGQRLMWQVTDRQGDFDKRSSQTWVADIDGGNPRSVGETVGLSWSEWIDDQRILMVGLPLDELPLVSIGTLTLGSGPESDQLVLLAHVARPRETLLSPHGTWLVYVLAFQDNPEDDGIWLVPTDGSLLPQKLDFFGGFHWRDETHILYVPMEPGVESHVLWEYDIETGESRPLTDPERHPFKIANNDWVVSNDGRYIAFVNATDRNIWLIDLTPSSP